ncbi:hypothetical protein [Paenibacillus campi]|uniref:hypothetical protein n=1 Tax=Paenibacillus campi TaxID=3106031 RepID=UPI002AFF3AE2|nr:hypothetical protein [Paenibacillus sp. SGZ-1009]
MMQQTNFEANFKKVMITVNGEPVGKGLVIDSVTYAPVREHELTASVVEQPSTAPTA